MSYDFTFTDKDFATSGTDFIFNPYSRFEVFYDNIDFKSIWADDSTLDKNTFYVGNGSEIFIISTESGRAIVKGYYSIGASDITVMSK